MHAYIRVAGPCNQMPWSKTSLHILVLVSSYHMPLSVCLCVCICLYNVCVCACENTHTYANPSPTYRSWWVYMSLFVCICVYNVCICIHTQTHILVLVGHLYIYSYIYDTYVCMHNDMSFVQYVHPQNVRIHVFIRIFMTRMYVCIMI
jgi:hypothetical protein